MSGNYYARHARLPRCRIDAGRARQLRLRGQKRALVSHLPHGWRRPLRRKGRDPHSRRGGGHAKPPAVQCCDRVPAAGAPPPRLSRDPSLHAVIAALVTQQGTGLSFGHAPEDRFLTIMQRGETTAWLCRKARQDAFFIIPRWGPRQGGHNGRGGHNDRRAFRLGCYERGLVFPVPCAGRNGPAAAGCGHRPMVAAASLTSRASRSGWGQGAPAEGRRRAAGARMLANMCYRSGSRPDRAQQPDFLPSMRSALGIRSTSFLGQTRSSH
jgi:hypothetical protein